MSILQYRSANCKNCYKCIRHCPIKAIEFKNNQARIVEKECIYCGECVKICPQKAKYIRNDMSIVQQWISEGKTVIASVAPSYVAVFETAGFDPVRKALQQFGFADAYETSMGANIVKQKYEQILEQEQPDILISSCCHSIDLLIQKHHPTVLKYLADVLTPMEAHGQYLKGLYPEAKIVFIGPCLAKKEEADRAEPAYIDATLTFAELTEALSEQAIPVETSAASDQKLSRFFPMTGGVIKTMEKRAEYEYVSVDGVEQCETILAEIAAGNIHHVFLEMNSCRGGCLEGPGMPKQTYNQIVSQQKLHTIAGEDYDQDFNLPFEQIGTPRYVSRSYTRAMPSEQELKEILAKMGKTSKLHELNCGACGYNSCREKAVAVFQGKADINMCLPFMRERAENISKQVLKTSPNAVIALDMEFKIQLFNRSAYELLNLDQNEQVIGEPIEYYLDLDQFVSVLAEGSIMDEVSFIRQCKKYVEKRVVFDEEVQMILIIMKDVTEQQMKLEQRKSLKHNTIEITDQIINKQMRIVQEIASLLGETTAETKTALKHLRDVVVDQDEE